MIFKLLITLISLVFWFLSQKFISRFHLNSNKEIKDSLHLLTSPINSYLNQSPTLVRWLLISSSLLIDLLGLFIIFYSLLGPSFKPLFCMIIIFLLRQLNQLVTILPAPEGMIWKYPGFPSLFVTYGVTQDLFFSGHTALATLGAYELFQMGGIWGWIGGLILIYEITVVLALRAHWTMDVFTGFIVSLFVCNLTSPWMPLIDSWFYNHTF